MAVLDRLDYSNWSVSDKQSLWLATLNDVYVESYIPSGAGTDKTQYLLACIADAGIGGIVRFKPNTTYSSAQPLIPMQSQTWMGNRAVITQPDMVLTTTSVDPSATLTIPVASVTGFFEGMAITYWTDQTDTAQFNTGPIIITNVSDNTLTVDAFSSVSLSGTVNVQSAQYQVRIENTDVTINDLIVDGNRAGHSGTILRRWEVQNGINAGAPSNNLHLNNVEVRESVAEGILFGGDNVTLENLYVHDINGNGVHGSSATIVKIFGHTIRDCNEYSAVDIGHQDGCISISDDCANWTVTGGFLINSRLSGIGGIANIAHDSEMIFTDNHFIGLDTGPLEMRSNSDNEPQWITFSDNHIDDCGEMVINSGSTSAHDPVFGNKFHQIINNKWYRPQSGLGSMLHVSNLKQSSISGNLFDGSSTTTDELVKITNSTGVAIRGNDFIGGLNQLRIRKSGSPVGIVTGVTVSDNQFIDAADNALKTEGACDTAGEFVMIEGNTYIAGPNTSNSRTFMNPDDRQFVKNNTLACNAPQDRGMDIVGDAVVKGNAVKGCDTDSIRIFAGATSVCIVADNEIQTAINDLSGATATIRNNDTITA